MTAIEIVAAAFGLASVWLTVKRNMWLWPTGLVMVVLYIVIFYEARLYSNMVLQGAYVILQIYGWHHWLAGRRHHAKKGDTDRDGIDAVSGIDGLAGIAGIDGLADGIAAGAQAKHGGEWAVERLSVPAALGWLGVAVGGAVVLGHGMATRFDAAQPYADAFITTLSLVAQWLLVRKVLENWLAWIVVDIVSVAVFLNQDLYLTAGLYAIFLAMGTVGYLEWRRSLAPA